MGAGKTFSSEKFNFSLRHPRERGEGGWGGRVMDVRECVCVRVCVSVCAKGIHFQLSYHTPLSTDMLACFFFFVFPEIHVRQTSVPITEHTHS